MKIAIDIPEELYNAYKGRPPCLGDEGMDMIAQSIANGTPLPKGHGDLVTKEQMIELVEFYQINPQHFDFVNLIDDIKDEKPIIEADKKGET